MAAACDADAWPAKRRPAQSAYTLALIRYIINIADVGHALELVSVFNPNPNPQITLYKSLMGCLRGATATSAGSASLCWRPAWLAPSLPAHQSGSVRAQRATDPSRPGLRSPPRQRQLLRDIPQGGSAALKGVCGAQAWLTPSLPAHQPGSGSSDCPSPKWLAHEDLV